jgi:thiamine biosynthesis lipoprotein
VEPLVELWGFGPEKKMPPDIQKIKDVLQYVGLDKIGLDEKREALIFGDPRIRIDFGGIADGYAADEVVKIFKRHNITKALINIGGDLYCMGTKADNSDWSIGIKNPENRDEILVRLKIRDKAVATSGNYENFYIYNSRRYTHIIDPQTGYTVSNNLTSVTIIADDCVTADALATAVFVLGENKGLKLIDKLSGIDCLLVIKRKGKQELLMSRGMERYIEK